ncbi:phytoene desaturase family protein [Cuniculiplasma sp. SKW3]|uniref:phytoene desaturase family protein n=1 Tax=Cuniculiplasma sp. SKW3 TaxID=3400170 RepID=UPI003FD52EDF
MMELPEAKKVVVIGAGLSGLASAILLRRKNYVVTVVEKNQKPGGVASVLRADGFTFDMGPSWVMMPEVFRWFYEKIGRNIDEELNLVKLDPHYKLFFQNGHAISIPDGYERIRNLFDGMEENGGKKLDKFISSSRKKYKVSMENFLWSNYKNRMDTFKMLLAASKSRIRLFQSYHSHVKKYFKNEELQKILEFTTVFLGGSPFNVPSIYDLMVSVDFDAGIWYPMGGIGKIVESLYDIAKQEGVDFIFGESARYLDTTGNTVDGIMTDSRYIKTDYVISACPYSFTENKLLPEQSREHDDTYWNSRVLAPSVIMMYLGIEGRIKGLEHHNLFLMDDWEEHFSSIYSNHTWPEKFSFYVSMTSKTDSTVAPPDHENIVVLIPVSAGLTATEEIYNRYLDQVLEIIGKQTGEELKDRIVVKRFFGPQNFASQYNSLKGSAFGLAHTLSQTAMFRPKNISRRVSNLFYAGQYTNPGIGMPMVIISASVATESLKEIHNGVDFVKEGELNGRKIENH